MLFCVTAALAAQEFSVNAAVSARELYVGEILYYQIQIKGTDAPPEPNLSRISDFYINAKTGSTNNSQSITIINGRRTESVSRGYNFTYTLSPKRAGRLEIPSIVVALEGVDYRTNPILIIVREPEKRSDYVLELIPSKEVCYVGEPITLNVVWAWIEDRGATELHQFTVPFGDDYAVVPLDEPANNGAGMVRLTVNDEVAVFRQSKEKRDDGVFTVLSHGRVIIPNTSGTLRIPQAIVSFEGISGYERRKDFFSGRTVNVETHDKFVISSNTPILQVKSLPVAGKPAGFSGLVGAYSISATATPVEVNVGDPITLRIAVAGPEYLDDVEVPDFRNRTEWAENFKFSSDDADGMLEDGAKVFLQTIRAKHEEVGEIPPVSISFYDTDQETYRTAHSDPISITVRPTRIVTIDDVEGVEPISQYTELESLDHGIAFNYQGADLAVDQVLGLGDVIRKPGWLVAWIVPIFAFIVPFSLIKLSVVKSRIAQDQQSRRSFRTFQGAIKHISDINDEERYGFLLNMLKGVLLD